MYYSPSLFLVGCQTSYGKVVKATSYCYSYYALQGGGEGGVGVWIQLDIILSLLPLRRLDVHFYFKFSSLVRTYSLFTLPSFIPSTVYLQ